MTRTELNNEIDALVGSKTAPNSITPTNSADAMKAIADYVDQEVDKGLVVLKVEQSGTSDPVLTVKKNNTNLTFTATRLAAGVYNITPSATISGDVNFKVFFNTASFIVPSYAVSYNTVFFQVLVRRWSGSAFGTADEVINNAYIEIEIF